MQNTTSFLHLHLKIICQTIEKMNMLSFVNDHARIFTAINVIYSKIYNVIYLS